MDNAEKTAMRAFAALIYNSPGTPTFQLALQLITNDTGRALWVSQHWPEHEFVRSELARLANEHSEEENRLPTKEDLSRKIWSWLDGSPGLMTFDEKIKAAKLYAELNEMIKKPEPATTVSIHQPFHVMEVHAFGEDDQWEAQLAAQQQGLLIEGERMLENDSVPKSD